VSAVVIAVGGFLGMLVVAIVIRLVTGEVTGWLPHVSTWLVRRATLRLPCEHRDRGEEWEADLHDYSDRPLSMLVIALRTWRNARASAREAAVPERRDADESATLTRPAFLEVRAASVSGASLTVSVGTAVTVEEALPITPRPSPPGSDAASADDPGAGGV
jgi:hypothetical protein